MKFSINSRKGSRLPNFVAEVLLLLCLNAIFNPAMAMMPWESPLAGIASSLCGPVAKTFGVVAIVGAGIMIAFGEVKGWIHNMLIVLIGVSIAVMAPSFLGMLGIASSIACA